MSKIVFFGASSIIGIATPASVGLYHWSQESIWDQLSEYVVPASNSDNTDWSLVWTALRTKLNSNQEIKDQSLLKVKALQDDSKGEKLKEWCFKSYEEIYWSWFQKENKDLRDEVKKACTQTIEEKLSTSKIVFDNSPEGNKDLFSGKINTLKNHKNEEAELDASLLSIVKNPDKEDNWKDLKEWCKDAYSKGYQGEKSNRWLLVQLYCKNS